MFLSREIRYLCRTNFIRSAGTLLQLVKNQNKAIHTFQKFDARISFNLSDIGEGIREVVVKEWFVKPGDQVSQFDEICEVQSDKATVTITSRYDGVVKKLHYDIDETAHVGKPLIDIETGDDDGKQTDNTSTVSAADAPAQHIVNVDNDVGTVPPKSDENKGVSEHEASKNGSLCVPSVRRLAKNYKVDLSQIVGTGKDGRILKEDVLDHLKISSTQDVERKVQQNDEVIPGNRSVPLTEFQKAMTKTMTASLKIPHLVYGDEIKVTKLSQLRRDVAKSTTAEKETRISFLPFFIKAASNALLQFPILNASLDENCDNIVYKSEHNVVVAMDTKIGLAVPVIRNVQKLSIVEISEELKKLVEKGRSGNFAVQDLSGGTFTVSNIGSIGGTYMKPCIMSHQSLLLALGGSRLVPTYDASGNVTPEEIINISAAADHRIIDGATVARFVQSLKQKIENPIMLLLNL